MLEVFLAHVRSGTRTVSLGATFIISPMGDVVRSQPSKQISARFGQLMMQFSPKSLHLVGEVQAGQALTLGERAVFDALRIGHEGGQPREVERLLADLHEMLAKVQIAQRAGAVKGVVADLAHAVDEYHIVQTAAEHELIAAGALKRRVADEGFQLLAVGEHHVRQLFDRFGQHQRAQMHPLGAVGLHRGIGVVLAGIKGVVVLAKPTTVTPSISRGTTTSTSVPM